MAPFIHIVASYFVLKPQEFALSQVSATVVMVIC